MSAMFAKSLLKGYTSQTWQCSLTVLDFILLTNKEVS